MLQAAVLLSTQREDHMTTSPARIADACLEFQSLIDVLDDAYWEASTVESKDVIYDILTVFHRELAELNKLSIQDHHYPYEMITDVIRQVSPKLHRLLANVNKLVERTNTQVRINRTLRSAITVVDQNVSDWSDHQ